MEEIIFDLFETPIAYLNKRVEETLVKFVQFVPQLIKHGSYSICYNKENLSKVIGKYEVCNASLFTFELNYYTDDAPNISQQEYRLILQSTNFSNILSFCFHMLLTYVKFCIKNTDEADYEFLITIINTVTRTYGILWNNSDWLQLNRISNINERFLEFLVQNVSNFDIHRYKEKPGFHLLNTRLLLLFKKDANCRNTIIDLIDKKLTHYLYDCQNQVEQDSIALENVGNMLFILKVMLECKYNPKEEILRTVIMNLHDEKSSSSSNCIRNNLTEMLQILIQYVPKNVKLLVEECINNVQPGKSIICYT